jgi:glycosyltransferase involved in cell wall biosynthesis
MEILIVSGTCSPEKYNEIDKQRSIKLLGPQQNFFNLLIKGFVNDKNIDVECLTAVPVSASCHPQKIWHEEYEEYSNNLRYKYLKFINGKILRYVTLNLSTYFSCKKWLKNNKNNPNKIILCDPLLAHCTSAANRAARKCRCKTVAIVTDLPSYVTEIGITSHGWIRKAIQKIYDRFSSKEMEKYDAYIFLTRQMNDSMNKMSKPFLVIEGSVDIKMKDVANKLENKEQPASIVYAGGIHEKFGVGRFARAFAKAKTNDAVLKIYGAGEGVEVIEKLARQDDRIKYMGAVSVTEIIKQEVRATLLVNPRPTDEPFTKYSFPSKTTEYMVSGTPVLSTRLPGIPDDYANYLYWFEGETEDDMKVKIEEILKKDRQELHHFGQEAKKFVLARKNNEYQARKILDFIKNI